MSQENRKKNKNISPKIDVKTPRLPVKKSNEIDKTYLNEHFNYTPGVWMRNPSSLVLIDDNEMDNEIQDQKENGDKMIKEKIELLLNEWEKENEKNIREIKEKIDNDLKEREKLLQEEKTRRKELEKNNLRTDDAYNERKKLENHYKKMIEEHKEKQTELENERKRINDIVKKQLDEQSRILDKERKELEEINKKLLEEENKKNKIEQRKLAELQREREKLMRREIEELNKLEKHEKQRKSMEDELERRVRAREIEKRRLEDLNNKIEELRKYELEELNRIKADLEEMQHAKDKYSLTSIKDMPGPTGPSPKNYAKGMGVDLCDHEDCGQKCILNPRDICIDPYSGKLVLKTDLAGPSNQYRALNEHHDTIQHEPDYQDDSRTLLTKSKYLDILSTYDDKKLKNKLAYQYWLINESQLEESEILEKFPGSHFSLIIDAEQWADIKEEVIKQYRMIQ